MRLRRSKRAAAAAGCLALLPLAVPSQGLGQTSHERVLATNVALGAVTGGVASLIRGKPIVEGSLLGAAGGGLVYVGKQLAGQHWEGSGLFGRQIASLGSSMIGNSASGRGAFDRVAFGLGPVHLYVGRARPAAWRVDGPGTALLLMALLSDDADLQVAESLSTGALVFRSRERNGSAGPGIIFIPDDQPYRRSYVLAHENVHILHFDQTYLSWSDPLEDWLASASPVTRAFHSRVELNLVGIGLAVWGARRWEHGDRPWEIEAAFLARDWE